MTADRRARDRKLIKYPELCERVIERIKDGWTPEQIGNRMIQEQAPLRVCQETIYRYIYSKEGGAMICGGISPRTVLPVGRVTPDDAENLSSTAMLVSCSASMRWHTAASLDIGKVI